MSKKSLNRLSKSKPTEKTTNPELFITTNKNRLKLYQLDDSVNGANGCVFMYDNQEFELEMYNPNNFIILGKIFINNKIVSDHGIVIRPGERLYLDRYLHGNKKYCFNKYLVENIVQNTKAIKDNGLVRVEFYKEQSITSTSITVSTMQYYQLPNNPWPWFEQPWVWTPWVQPQPSTIEPIYTSDTTHINCCNTTNTITSQKCDNPDEIVTGIVGMGNESKQLVYDYNGQFENVSFYQVEYKILPIENIAAADMRKYCSCNYRIRKDSWKYCPKCGNKL